MNSRIYLRIARIRNILNQQTQNDNDKVCHLDYETYGINHIASKQEFQEQKAPEDFRKIKQYFEDFCETREQLGDEQILDKCENLFEGGIHVAKNCQAVGTKYSRNNRENFGISCNNKINGG